MILKEVTEFKITQYSDWGEFCNDYQIPDDVKNSLEGLEDMFYYVSDCLEDHAEYFVVKNTSDNIGCVITEYEIP